MLWIVHSTLTGSKPQSVTDELATPTTHTNHISNNMSHSSKAQIVVTKSGDGTVHTKLACYG